MNARAATQPEQSVIRGRVETVFFAGPKWSSGKLETTAGAQIRFRGNLYAREGDPLVLRGYWVHDRQFGRQFEVTSMEYDMALDTDGLANFLAKHPDLKGIGVVKAKILADEFGDDFENALVEEPQAMAEAAHLPLETIFHLREIWQSNALLNRASAWLASFELTYHQVSTLLKRLGNNAVAILKENPYLLVREVAGFGFKRIDNVALKLGVPKEHEGRIRAGVLDCIQDALDEGHCWLEYEDLVRKANDLLAIDDCDSWHWIENATDALLDDGALSCVISEFGRLIANPKIVEMEKFLATMFRPRLNNIHFRRPAESERLLREAAPDLNPEQFAAAFNALRYMISLMSGGAGSGKTFTIKAILDVCKKKGLSVLLAAPTGKAAKRMEQMTGHPASTIHKLLGYNGSEYYHGPDNPISTDFLIIDEMSMVDVPLAWRLFRSLRLDMTAVLMVGDHNQLPPVGPGNVLRDIVQRQLVPTVILKEIVRQAGVLKENCISVLSGKVPATSEREASGKKPWLVFNDLDNPDEVPNFIRAMYEQVLAQKCGYDLILDVQVLTPTHKGPMGTRALNIMLQRLLQKMLFNVDVPPVPEKRRPKLYANDKVIQIRNNYDLGVMNGAIGIIRRALPDGGMEIEFDGELKEIPAKSPWLQDIELAYALTIHKCVAGDTLIATGDGLMSMHDIGGRVRPGTTSGCYIRMYTHAGYKAAVNVSNEGEKDCIRLETKNGFSLTASTDHKVYVATDVGVKWVSMNSLVPGDTLVMRRGTMLERSDIPIREVMVDGDPRLKDSLMIDEGTAWVLGVLVGRGKYDDDEYDGMDLCASDHNLLLQFVSRVQGSTGDSLAVTPMSLEKYRLSFNDSTSRELFMEAGLGYDGPAEKRTPWAILQSGPKIQCAYLRGLFDSSCWRESPTPTFWTFSERLSCEVQQLLFANGILSSRNESTSISGKAPQSWIVSVDAEAEVKRFTELIDPQHLERTASNNSRLYRPQKGLAMTAPIPFGKALIIDCRLELLRRPDRIPSTVGSFFHDIILDEQRLHHTHVEWLVRQIPDLAVAGPACKYLQMMCDWGYVFEYVKSKTPLRAKVYDFLVPEDHSYIGNGFINHNCQGSEYPCVIAIIHKAHSFQHHRNLFYTAVTRARDSAIILGDRWGVRFCAQKKSVDLRQTFLSLAPDLGDAWCFK